MRYKLFSDWMFFLKEHPNYLDRFAECFWPSQILSKEYAIDFLEPHLWPWGGVKNEVYIFGGWYGIFAQMLNGVYKNNYYNIDIDPECETVFNLINTDNNIRHFTSDMSTFVYNTVPDLVINTSTEHVPQEVYDTWWKNIPRGTKYFIQGNNFFESEEHVRCTETLEEFLQISHTNKCEWADCFDVGMRPDGRPFYRFIAFGTK